MSEDIVNPKRYTYTKLECWNFWLKAGLNPIVASAVKYVWRYKYKNGLEDLDKASVFLKKAEDDKTFIYYSERPFTLNDIDVKDGLDASQILFMRGAILTNRYETYDTGIDIMRYALATLIKEYKPIND